MGVVRVVAETLGVSQENLLKPQEGTEILVWS